MDDKEVESKEDLLKRLRRIEGQVKGIQRMIEEEKGCMEVLTQVAAVRAAINKAGCLILEKHSMTCIENAATSDDKKQSMGDLVKAMQTFMKFVD